MLREHKELLDEISNHFKIQPRFIVSILGMESFYGRNQGKVDTIKAVTTLAFDRRRSNFYKKQLFAALEILLSVKKKAATVIIKHANPCGVSVNESKLTS